eukprot:TRINITY_DN8406_c0_g1_i4.p1 TRINITY_DN8406_c0_g1~~TRINITY_DN8406_c0_g1_i4.p1  ORF type:complete len:148 (+),score=26.31 TRINITY_DN8406_c0_g1_i4:248-691(+)
MSDIFTPNEWERIKTADDPLREFYVHWALKESYVKASGEGVGLGLQRISFTSCLKTTDREPVRDASVRFDGAQLEDWCFEQLWLDPKHVVAIASHPPLPDEHLQQGFDMLDAEDLLLQLEDCAVFALYDDQANIEALFADMKDKMPR